MSVLVLQMRLRSGLWRGPGGWRGGGVERVVTDGQREVHCRGQHFLEHPHIVFRQRKLREEGQTVDGVPGGCA